MTVCSPIGKLSWKLTIPIAMLLLVAATGIWFLPVRGYYLEQRLWKYALQGIASLSAVILIGMLMVWTIFGDIDDNSTC